VSGPVYIARLLFLGLIIAVNAFFAAAETALLSVRDSRLRHLAEEGSAGARAALTLLEHPEKLLSMTQIGVTLASLGLGWAGEETLYELFMRLFHPAVVPAWAALIRGAAFLLSFLVMTWSHVVIGEVVPKNLAIDKADRLAVVVAPVLLVLSHISSTFVSVIERSALVISHLLGTKGEHRAGGHSAEELRVVVSSSRSSGHLPEKQEDMIHGILDLENLAVHEIMKPRHEIISVPVTARLDEVLDTMISSGHSRLPVWKDQPENIVGLLFFKDMLSLWRDRRVNLRNGRARPQFQLERTMRKPLIVPETKLLPEMLEEFRTAHTHLALIVDEFGTVSGLVTVEDVLEQIVGEIHDEHDDEAVPAPEDSQEAFEVEGSTPIRDLESRHGIELPANEGFATVAGYMLYVLGHIPVEGESVDALQKRFTVTQMVRNRIARVMIEPLDTPPAHPETSQPVREGTETDAGS
jgi:CBS domain containing-hemolysin-like protein